MTQQIKSGGGRGGGNLLYQFMKATFMKET